MEKNNPKYLNQGIHVISSIFTIEKGIIKVLLIKRSNEPYYGKWALVGGALYNDEEIKDGALREIKEKSGIENIDLNLCNVFGKIDRSPIMRMVGISYLGVVDIDKVNILRKTRKTDNANWFPITEIPNLAYDHNEILDDAIIHLKELIMRTNILKSLFPNYFTLPELKKVYESILGINLDRRNFRKKLLTQNIIEPTTKQIKFEGKKPAIAYKFK